MAANLARVACAHHQLKYIASAVSAAALVIPQDTLQLWVRKLESECPPSGATLADLEAASVRLRRLYPRT